MTNLSWQLLFPTRKRKKLTPANLIFLIVIARSSKHKSLNGSQVSCLSDSYLPCSLDVYVCVCVRVCVCVLPDPLFSTENIQKLLPLSSQYKMYYIKGSLHVQHELYATTNLSFGVFFCLFVIFLVILFQILKLFQIHMRGGGTIEKKKPI